ncbi:hypothetical protein AURDEDRAFT_173410 [Auricularia subglabra TFB-10046 SS5]|uniref:Uncharacterized protein n=1 Tax=Auricularia subglabra (strain TFB-10046 / SS5) TaxID=717982 RepID=J0DAS5_AURST|nr:hypothetical protein AURDEDRAFT_173410 [Auricularia subglabra TFB-10046 SS5]
MLVSFALNVTSLIIFLQVPSLVALVICATRMYRGLVLYNRTSGDAFTMTSTQICWQTQHRASPDGSIAMPRTFIAYSTTDDDTQVSLGQATKSQGAFGPAALRESKEALSA